VVIAEFARHEVRIFGTEVAQRDVGLTQRQVADLIPRLE
jgi:hypothetical protein